MVLISEACRESFFFSVAKIFGFCFFSVFFVTYTCEMACNLAIICPTKECLPPSCSSRDSTSDEIVFIMQSLNMAARTCKTANDSKTSSNPFL